MTNSANPDGIRPRLRRVRCVDCRRLLALPVGQPRCTCCTGQQTLFPVGPAGRGR